MASLEGCRRWTMVSGDRRSAGLLAEELGVAPLVARIMVARGISSVRAAKRFLEPSLDRDWGDPLAIPGMADASMRLARAIEEHESIAIFGDFDVDGITSTCLLTEGLRALGARVQPFIPNRFGEGYGITETALERVIRACAPSLIVTVDNGIAAGAEVDYLCERGIDLVVTDHHEPGESVPQGVPVVDPKLEASGCSHELAGAGVALKLVQALGDRSGAPDLWRGLTDLAALGTVSDMMELTPENRALVADGIARVRDSSRPAFSALASLAGVDLSAMTAEALSFSLIPRLNAAGRLADPALALDLLLEWDPVEAGRRAAELEKINTRRRELEAELAEDALALVGRASCIGRVIVAGKEGWHEGVKGIVASRLVNRFHVPVVLFSIEGGIARGSGRSVGSVNLFDAMSRCADLLIRFGGHAGAVGATLDAARLPDLRERLAEILDELPAEAFEDRAEIATEVALSELDVKTVAQISVLEPFGRGNAAPLLAARGVTMIDRAGVGRSADHMRFRATDGIATVPAIMFRAPDVQELCACESAVDLVFQAIAERWRGQVKTKLLVKDILVRSPAPIRSSAPTAEPRSPLVVETGESVAPRADAEEASARRARFAALTQEELTTALLQAFIGDGRLHRAQREALDALSQAQSCLAIMGTGRGKSLVFQVHAVREALRRGRASVLVYPLRALVADQAFHLVGACESFGLTVGVLTGETDSSARESAFDALASGGLDIVLTTPEFFTIHAERFAASGRIGFVVIDEAHHAGLAKSGQRSAYLDMPRALDQMDAPTVLATTATADADVSSEICSLLHIERVVVDESVRANLRLEDGRDLACREDRLVSIVARGEKCVVYVNSRDRSVALTRMLRKRVPDIAVAIAYYNAGLSRLDRCRVEDAFREGTLVCIVSTSAFGEGVNLPDIRHVVLYHMPFSAVEFNQMSGRAGRDGETACIHLLYTRRDARINENLLDAAAPPREELAVLYRALQTLRQSGRGGADGVSVRAPDGEIAQMCHAIRSTCRIDERSVDAGISIFEELGLLRVIGFDEHRAIEMGSASVRVELTRSILYLEGLHARLAFSSFMKWALDAPSRDMLARMNRPITPRAEHAIG
ncbi:exonuclease RecJ [Coriobacterium glomerans PW2]|uniref:Single-stranded-DNA-specific exonuclease RecJ n=1 Tax=Coriobacterium glomerans (strain ATCC 49209 / DSM 20642 / JCM 10262 / PW2) TaxID=700015 RepID=F2NBI7_CORGP|nr:single-stranded-DNA-specific exonuclease RecJ [Coriobacterium glomerans]AEB06723.1 exonuclease RecJ [Coriobacterium glomerans PW2]